ncbi:hypothetical protein [Marixanthomonas spongiae]|uniref:Glycine dehydrogenase n=1 Tax=Marixanthomonas spongiae TaxID=2174845 RepID=A0A2U0HX53_9FLAO|nr:hypothetical protein [Marixanthomonas spongiae]PVW13320.1 hypothetical protein DDV96_13210 [Marixanthomonas spongiae]
MKLNMIFNCEEAAHVCDRAQYNEASLWEKTLLTIHTFFCKLCRKHTTRNARLTKAIKKSEVQTLSAEQKHLLKKRLRQEMMQ